MGFLIEGIVGRAWLTGNVFVCVSTQVDERGQADDGHYYHAAIHNKQNLVRPCWNSRLTSRQGRR